MNILKRILSFLNLLYVRLLAATSVTWLIYTVLKEFSIFDIVKNPSASIYLIYLIVAILLAVILFTATSKLITIGLYYSDRIEVSQLKKALSQRIGTTFSQNQVEKEHIDNKHEFYNIFRHDYLDYSKGDYFSNRFLSGRNISSTPSSGLTYCESTEYKVPFTEVMIDAFDQNSGDKLFVECLQNENIPVITHIFKIHFKEPIVKGQEFSIAYSIFFPNELTILNNQREVMSISLNRIKRKIKKLSFIISHDGILKTVKGFKKKNKNISIISDRHQKIRSDFTVSQDYEKHLEKPKIIHPHLSGLFIDEPDADLYIIEYVRDHNE